MNLRIACLSLLVFAGTTGALTAVEGDQAKARAEITYQEPEKFTDVRADSLGSERDRDSYLKMLREHIEERVAKLLPAGYVLEVTVTDVDMAGEFEPWRGPRFHDIRVVKDIYPPRINLEFKLVNATGEVVQEGARNLRDMSFMMNLSINRNDSLRHEKELLDRWLRDDFGRVKA